MDSSQTPAEIAERLTKIGDRRRRAAGLPSARVYSVPRRYDLWTMLVAGTAFGLLFAAMKALGWSPSTAITTGLFFLLVATAQALLFRGEHPRASSLICGGFCLTAFLGYEDYSNRYIVPPDQYLICIVYGAMLGYLIGALIGGVFLVAEAMRSTLRRVSRGP